jgi:polysaccharide biosynthesis transport protein
MPTPVTETSEGGQRVEWSETFHAFLFRARIYLKRFWWIIIITVAAGGFIQKWKMRDAKPTYYSTAEMNVSNLVSIGTTSSINELVANFFQNQIHLMKSADLQKEAYDKVMLQHPEFGKQQPPPWVNPDAAVIPGTSILSLTATGSDPAFTQDFLNDWMESFLNYRNIQRDQVFETYIINLEKVAKDYQSQVQDKTNELSDYVNKHSFATVDAAEKAAGEAQAKLSSINDEITAMDAQLQFLEPLAAAPTEADQPTTLAATPPAPTAGNDQTKPLDMDEFKNYVDGNNGQGVGVDEIDREVDNLKLLAPDLDYKLYNEQLLSLQLKAHQLGLGLGPRHPKMTELANQLDQLQSTLRELRRRRVTQLQKIVNILKIERAAANETKKTLEQTNKEDNEIINTIRDDTTKIQLLTNTYNFAVQSSASLTENHEISGEILQINLHATLASEQTVDPLRPVTEGAFVGLAAGIAIIFLLGALDGRIMSVEDLSQRFEEPMLGVIPMQKRVNGQVELLKHGDPRQMFAESCRNIRSSLLYMDRQGQRPRIIMLTSSMPSEGKSTLSSNLAITLGFAASRTLLVDADMRRGQLHKRFGLPNELGLAEHIGQGVPLEKIIQSTGSENLDFISCGKYPAQPGELLMSDRFRDSIQTLRQRYDFVVFDSPPILLTDDAASFATRADAVIFVVRAGFTRLRQVRTSLESLHRRGVNVYGMVMNFIDHREPSYYSYRYYDYYSYGTERPERAERSERKT